MSRLDRENHFKVFFVFTLKCHDLTISNVVKRILISS